jgi:hypothetical protein
MKVWTRIKAWASLLAALAVVTPTGAAAYPAVPQDSKSKALLALPPDEADQVRRRDLLSDLQPVGQFLTDLNGNVDGMTFVTWPYLADFPFVCREDSITLQYGHADFSKEPRQIEARALFYVDGDPSIGGRYGAWQGCDKRHPGPKANWFTAPTALDAVQASQIFRKAETDVASGSLKPAPCDRASPDACRQWILSLNDPTKIDAVDGCASSPGADVCYVISIGDERLTIGATISAGRTEPTAITSIKVEEVVYLVE